MGHWFASGTSRASSSPAALMADGGGWLGRARERSRWCFIGPGRVEAFPPHLRGLQGLQHGRRAVATCDGAGGQWRKAVRPPVSAHKPRGTDLSSLRASLALDAQWRRWGPRTARSSGASACARGRRGGCAA
jgi:hypothetical protein